MVERIDRDPQAVLRASRGRLSGRKLRLLSLACVRRFECFLSHPRLRATREAVDMQERQLDGRATAAEFAAARTAALAEIERNVAAGALDNWTGSDMAHILLGSDPEPAAVRHIDRTQDFAFDVVADRFPAGMTDDEAWKMVTGPVRAQLCRWVRDVAGPARLVRIRPEWRTPAALAMASDMYARRDFVALPVLAEVLQAAGCRSRPLLNHCREPGEHIPGCWVVDLVRDTQDAEPGAAVDGRRKAAAHN